MQIPIPSKESLLVEFKHYVNGFGKKERQKLIKEFVAIYNSFFDEETKGYIYIGVDDNGDIQGINQNEEDFFNDELNFNNLLKNFCINSSGINVNPEIKEIDNKKIVEIEINKNKEINLLLKKNDDNYNDIYVRYGSGTNRFDFKSLKKLDGFFNKKLKRTKYISIFSNYIFKSKSQFFFLLKKIQNQNITHNPREQFLLLKCSENEFYEKKEILEEEIQIDTTSKTSIWTKIMDLYYIQNSNDIEKTKLFHDKILNLNALYIQYENPLISIFDSTKNIEKGYHKFQDNRFKEMYYNEWEKLILDNPEKVIFHTQFEQILIEKGWEGDRNSDVINQTHKPNFIKSLREKVDKENYEKNQRFAIVSDLNWKKYNENLNSNSRGGYCYTNNPEKISDYLFNNAKKIKSIILSEGYKEWFLNYKRISNKEKLKNDINEMLKKISNDNDRELIKNIFEKLKII